MNSPGNPLKTRPRLVILPTLALGILLTLYMQFQVREDVFYGGDAGLKYLMVKQYARGDFSPCRHLDAPAWAREIWDKGAYPFGPPFVYETEQGHVVVFPVLFQILSTPFFLLLGSRGLYVIPMLSLWLLWWRFYATCRALDLKPVATAFGLAALIFASPLTFYGTIFWEHTLAVLLVFLGVEFTVRSWTAGFSPRAAIPYGILTSLSAYLRPEAFLMAVPLLVALLVRYLRDRKRETLLFVVAGSATLGILLVANQILYGHPLSARSLQVLGGVPLEERLVVVSRIFSALHLSLFKTFPLIFAFLAAGPFLFRPQRRPAVLLAVALAIVLLLAAALILPNDGGKQRGPRYLLPALPVIALACACQLHNLMIGGRRAVKIAYWAVFLALFCPGLVSNTYGNSRHLALDYATRIHPALMEIRGHDPENVVIFHQYMALELAAEHGKRNFFLVKGSDGLRRISSLLRKNGVDAFWVVTYRGSIQPQAHLTWRDDAGGPLVLDLKSLGGFGEYELFSGHLDNAE